MENVTKVIIWPHITKGITIYFNNGKLNLHPFLNNYEDVEKILKINNVQNIFDQRTNLYEDQFYQIEFLKNNYKNPKNWIEETIRAHSYHGEIPKEYLERIKDIKNKGENFYE